MEKISIFIVFILSLFFPITIGRLCSDDKYFNGKDCVQCPPCPPGKQFTRNCGYDEQGQRTRDAQCKVCRDGVTFNNKDSTGNCRNCQRCTDGKITKAPCTPTSNTVCECPKGTYIDWSGACRQSSTKAPLTTPGITTPVITTTTQVPTQSDEPKHNRTQEPSTTVSVKSPEVTPNDGLKAEQKENRDRPFPQPGWIVLFCLLGFLTITAFIFLSCHKRTRKQISGFFCRKYGVLWSDADRDATSDLMNVEARYEEQQVTPPINYATPIPPWDEPVPTIVNLQPTSEQVYCSCVAKDIEDEKMQCACTLTTSDPSIDKMVHNSSSAETIPEELQYYNKGKRAETQTPTRKISPCPSSSSGVFSLRPPDHCHLISPCVTPTPPRGLSPSHCRATTPSPTSSTCVTPRGCSPVHHGVTTSSSSSCETPPRRLSPEHRCVTPSSCSTSPVVTPRGQSPDLSCVTFSPSSSSCTTPLRGRSPDPASVPSYQIQISEEQEISNQSNECSQIPISIEASDKKHDFSKTPSSINSSPAAKKKRIDCKTAGKRNLLSPKKEPNCVCQHESHLKNHWLIDPNHCKEAVDNEKDVPGQVPSNKNGTESCVTTSIGIDVKMADETEDKTMKANVTVNNHVRCMYRPINRHEGTEHRCEACCPQRSDSFFQLINRERLCLKEEICKELNKSFKELAILGRVESEMKEYEASSKPAERVLEKLNALNPDLKLEEFEEMLRKIKRLDTVAVIYNHHLSCTLCQRNRFDSNV
ncbi:hypothetical protein ACROYT_G017770 [Oculina patagonica]